MEALVTKTSYDSQLIFTHPVDKLVHHPLSTEIVTKPLADSEFGLFQPLGIEFTQFMPLKKNYRSKT